MAVVNPRRRLVVGISGASGVIYGIRLLEMLRDAGDVEVHLVMTATARMNVRIETDHAVADIEKLASEVHDDRNLAASISSGSFRTLGMIVAPCSIKTLSGIATSDSDNLLTRAADVVLKERRRLVLMPREAPLNLAHLRNMVSVTEMGGIVYPPLPAFYHRPESIAQMVDHTCGRVLELFGIEQSISPRWEGIAAQ